MGKRVNINIQQLKCAMVNAASAIQASSDIIEKYIKENISPKIVIYRPIGMITDYDIDALKYFAHSYEKYKTEYKEMLVQYENYFRLHGIIIPKNLSELLDWICEYMYPEESLGYIIIVIGLKDEHFRLFHEFKEKQFNGQQIEYLNQCQTIFGELTLFPSIAERLKSWITGATDAILQSIILLNHIPDGSKKPIWIGGQADAFRFMEWCGMIYPADFRRCIEIEELHNKNRPKEGSTPSRGSIYYAINDIQIPKKNNRQFF